jgi:hypothetical protein
MTLQNRPAADGRTPRRTRPNGRHEHRVTTPTWARRLAPDMPAKRLRRPPVRQTAPRLTGSGGPAQPSLTIGQCLNGGYGWLEVECHRCKTRASLPSREGVPSGPATAGGLNNCGNDLGGACNSAKAPARDDRPVWIIRLTTYPLRVGLRRR